MRAPTHGPARPVRSLAVCGALSIAGVAELLSALEEAPRELPMRIDLRQAHLEPPIWLAFTYAVLLTRRQALRVDGVPPPPCAPGGWRAVAVG